jgi:diguanylate cyclase (GGDEF)-like protein
VVRRIERIVAEPVSYQGHQLRVTASVGVAYARPDEQVTADELIRRADAAMYAAKRAPRETPAVSEPDGQRR